MIPVSVHFDTLGEAQAEQVLAFDAGQINIAPPGGTLVGVWSAIDATAAPQTIMLRVVELHHTGPHGYEAVAVDPPAPALTVGADGTEATAAYWDEAVPPFVAVPARYTGIPGLLTIPVVGGAAQA